MNDLFGGVEDTGELHRLFFALWPDTATRHRIAETVSWMKQQGVPRARWSNASFYHLTLEFLGDWPTLPDHVVRRACAAAGDVDAARFDLALDAAGSFNAPTTP